MGDRRCGAGRRCRARPCGGTPGYHAPDSGDGGIPARCRCRGCVPGIHRGAESRSGRRGVHRQVERPGRAGARCGHVHRQHGRQRKAGRTHPANSRCAEGAHAVGGGHSGGHGGSPGGSRTGGRSVAHAGHRRPADDLHGARSSRGHPCRRRRHAGSHLVPECCCGAGRVVLRHHQRQQTAHCVWGHRGRIGHDSHARDVQSNEPPFCRHPLGGKGERAGPWCCPGGVRRPCRDDGAQPGGSDGLLGPARLPDFR